MNVSVCLCVPFSLSVHDHIFGTARPIFTNFYLAMLRICGTRHGPVAVCLCPSVISRCSTKTAKRRITQTTPHDSTGTVVFCPRDLTGVTPYGGAKCRSGGSKSATFDK